VSGVPSLFEELMAGAPHEAGVAYRGISTVHGLSLRVYVDGVSGLPGFSIRVQRAAVPKEFQLPRIRGISADVAREADAKVTQQVTYRIHASRLEYVPVFIELTSRLIDEAAKEQTVGAVLSRISQRLALWERFFDGREPTGLSRERQLGLIGELCCLESLAEGGFPSDAALAWRGSEISSHHDFQFPRGSIEAKLSTSSAPARLAISSARQLDETAVQSLFIHAVLAQEVASGRTTVSSQAAVVRALLQREAPAALPHFEEQLFEAGFIDGELPETEVHVHIQQRQFLAVTETFPRIRPHDLMPGIFNVRYDLEWSALQGHFVTITDVLSALND